MVVHLGGIGKRFARALPSNDDHLSAGGFGLAGHRRALPNTTSGAPGGLLAHTRIPMRRCRRPFTSATFDARNIGRMHFDLKQERRVAQMTYRSMASILAVDDSDGLRGLIAKVAIDEGHTVSTARDGREAPIACCTVSYDVVITDLRMPNMGGGQLIRELRVARYSARFCIMGIGFGGSESVPSHLARKFGADVALSKPFGIGQVRDVLRGLTGQTQHGSAVGPSEPDVDGGVF
jgi:CheY-like chemotaxis protein